MKALLFDLDNTLVRFKRGFEFWVPLITRTLLSHGIEADSNKSRRILSSGMINRNLEVLGLDIHAFWATFNVENYKACRQGLKDGEITLYEDALPALRRLKQEYLAIVSNTHIKCVNMELSHLGLKHYFKRIVAYTGEEMPKPHPQMALAALNGGKFEDTYVIGDARADIFCGRAIGAKTIYVKRFGDSIEADHVVNNLEEIPDIIS